MHLNALVALFTLLAAVDASDYHVRLAKRQSASASSPSSSPSSSVSSASSGSSSASAMSPTSSGSASPVPTTPVGTTIPPLSQITSGMATPSTLPVTATYPAGATPPISGAPTLPTPFVFVASQWPPQDQIAPTNGTCANDPSAVADAASRGWWTCGGYTRVTDITACPSKMTWGVRALLSVPQVLVEEYMAGHEIAVHTWSHRLSPLLWLTTQQVVAELGYTRKAIKQVLGVTPTLMRPPYGDIDDRVRAITLAMGMVPVIWTRTPSGATFDTNDWKVPGGVVTGPQSFATFQAILNNATTLNTGFVVLEHDLYAQTVDLAIGYTLPAAETFNPPLTFDSIGHCNAIPATNLYRESNKNTTFPYPNTTLVGSSNSTGSASKTGGAALNAAISLPAIRSVNPQGRWKILVVDDYSQKLLGSVLKQFDILEENVTLIESISNYREPQQFEAVYILMPTTQNVERIIKDFSNDQQQYLGAHLFFIEGLSEPLFQRLTSSAAEPFLRGLQELFLNFWVVEAQTFSLNSPSLFFNIYSPPRNEAAFRTARSRLEEELLFVSKTITNLCITLNEFPFIRYYFPSHHLPLGPLKAQCDAARAYENADTEFVTRLLAFMVQRNLDEYKPDVGSHPYAHQKPSDPPRPRGTLIITDRSMDAVAPLIHEFTYQAMCNDLLPIEDGAKYTYKFQSSLGAYEDKTATISETDTVWTTVRHMHMREAIDKLMADFNKFMEENAGFKGEGAASLNDMKDMLANLPQYQEQREKFSLHLNMAQECMGIFEKHKLSQVANVEQCCATGMTVEGKSPKTLVEEMVPLLDTREIINPNKVRMVALYIMYRDGVPDEDRRRLYQHARLGMAEQDAVNSLSHLGVRITRSPTDKDTKKKIKQKPSQEEEYDLSRYKPLLRTVIEDHVNSKLDTSLFPYVKDAPSAITHAASPATPTHTSSLRSAKPSWHKAVRSNAPVDNRQRVIVFMAGGMTYSEIRECYALGGALNKDIYIGSTHTITPRQFIDDLKVLELGGVGSRAVPNGVSTSAAHQSYQEYYDQKYFIPDPVLPQRPTLAVPKDSGSSGRSGKLSKPSPSSSYAASETSVNSTGAALADNEKKKKKKGFFRF
ncbi:Sec1 family-domain-containing protein [Lanmaoa asiatica]|nr:Sec1 family-domain-containing protein [Lanmaoa asiatica]